MNVNITIYSINDAGKALIEMSCSEHLRIVPQSPDVPEAGNVPDSILSLFLKSDSN
ncbi:MAG: hypothetical protein IJR85_00400 [Synergistaceae bacterium]|nr:hypothetical protein [Synergistaceae bacterium]